MIELPTVLIGNILIVYYSLSSFKKPLTHGFYRFFAWEIILIQFALNEATWFKESFAWHQWISWLLLLISIIFLIESIYLIKKIGKPATTFETTTKLVTIGIYKLIRHPMYELTP